jgi:fructose-specific phosphotransferase system component IIB
MKLGDSEKDQKLLKAIKATLWKKAKEAVNAEVSKMDSRPEGVNRMKSERMLSLATKKYINSIKDEIDATLEDMIRKEKERAENKPIDLTSDSDSDMRRNYREDDTKIHEDTLEEVKKVMKLGDSEEDQKLIKAIKATLWKKAKEAINNEVSKMDSRPDNVNRMKSERMLSLATKKYINSIKDEIDATLEDMARKEKENPSDLSSESDGKKPLRNKKFSGPMPGDKPRRHRDDENMSSDEDKPKRGRKGKKEEPLSITTMSD